MSEIFYAYAAREKSEPLLKGPIDDGAPGQLPVGSTGQPSCQRNHRKNIFIEICQLTSHSVRPKKILGNSTFFGGASILDQGI